MEAMLPKPKPFEAPKTSAKTHVFIGVYRPTFEEMKKIETHCILEGVLSCPCGHSVKYRASWYQRMMRCWKEGCYDTPVHVSIRDMLAPVHNCLIEMLKKAETISKGGLPGDGK